MTDTPRWKVSIIGQGEADPRTLLAHPLNPKIHPEDQDTVVAASLDELGWLRRILINQPTGHVLDGHERLKLAIERGEPTVPYDLCDIPAEKEGIALRVLDASAALAQVHLERWALLNQEAQPEAPALQAFFLEQAQEHGLVDEDSGLGHGRPVDEAEVPEDRLPGIRERWPVAQGEIWACGRHRLLCGNCLDTEAVSRLLDGVQPTMVLADPPYGIAIVLPSGYVGGGEEYRYPFGGVKRDARKRVSGGQRVKDRTGQYPIQTWAGWPQMGAQPPEESPASRRASVRKYPDVLGDESTATAVQAATHFLVTYPEAIHVWWGGNYYTDALPPSSCWLVWDKETTGNFADCELAWTNQPRATRLFTHRWNGMLRDSERERRWHPTQKPAALMAWVYDVVGTPEAVVLDPFLGSGPTLIAAEQGTQTVYGCEESPDYIAITLERWALLTGSVPTRVG